MRQAGTRELFDYWNRLRGERAAPERSDIDLVAIRGLLSDTFMLDVDFGHRFPFVMSGSRVNALFCAEQKSRSFLELWPLREVHNIAAVLLTVIDAACPVVACADARPDGYAKADLEILFLPLHHRGHAQARILGLMAPMAKPTWLGLLAVGQLTLRSLRAVDGTMLPLVTGAEFSERQRAGGRELRRHLRVFQGGK
jgi:hypothetical protein